MTSSLVHPIIIKNASLNDLTLHLSPYCSKYNRTILISSDAVLKYWENSLKIQFAQMKVPFDVIVIPDGESAKTFEQAVFCWDRLSELGADRQSWILGFGGGTVTDLVGLVAGCYMRGVNFGFIPTTLMGMVDAALGGKSGVNFKGRKNLIGLFKAPEVVLIDPQCLKTLPQKEWKSGLAEIIKYAIIGDEVLFEELEREIGKIDQGQIESWIQRCSQAKMNLVDRDPLDQHDRLALNYGHTFAHALEAISLYHPPSYSHGEAVAIGMSCAAHVSVLMKKLSEKDQRRQDELCLKAGLPIDLPLEWIDQVVDKMKQDKKSISQKINLILPEKIGKVVRMQNIDPDFLKQALRLKHRDSLERTRSTCFTNNDSLSRIC